MSKSAKSVFFSSFTESIIKKIDLAVYDSIYVGFSGGADSTALLLILNELSRTQSFCLYAVHFEHGLRGKDSVEDAKWCKEFCRERNIKLLSCELNVKSSLRKGEGIEAGARRLRLEVWKRLADVSGAAVALGHHSGDKIENIFIRLMRGSNVSGLTSLRTVNYVDGVCFIRPLLDFSREQIETFLVVMGIHDWREDATNNEDIYQRNYIRNNILYRLKKDMPELSAGLSNAYNVLEEDAVFIENEARKEYNSLINYKIIPVDFFKALPSALQVRVLRYWLKDNSDFEIIPDHNLMTRLKYEISRELISRVFIPVKKDIFLKLENQCISFYRQKDTVKKYDEPVVWDWNKTNVLAWNDFKFEAQISNGNVRELNIDKETVYFDADVLPEELVVRSWNEGDRITPFKSKDAVRIKKIFKNEKVNVSDRKNIPILCTKDNQILWIAGVRRSDIAVTDEGTAKVVFFTVSRINEVDFF